MSVPVQAGEPTWKRVAGSEHPGCDAVIIAEVGGARLAIARIGGAISVVTNGPASAAIGGNAAERLIAELLARQALASP